MHRVGAHTTARWVDVRELGKSSRSGVDIKVGQRLDLTGAVAALSPGIEPRIWPRAAFGVHVVDPSVVSLAQLLEDGPLWMAEALKGIVVCAVTVGGTRCQGSTVGVGWLLCLSVTAIPSRAGYRLTPATSEC